MKLNKKQREIILIAVQERENAKQNYLAHCESIKNLIHLVSGKEEFGNWRLEGEELIFEEPEDKE